MFAYIISIYCPCSCTMQFTGGVVYCDFNLPGCSCIIISIYQDVRVQWFQFASRYSRTMISIYQTISRIFGIMISIYQRIFAYHDFNLPEYVRVPWFQFTRWNSRTMISFYQRMFAYHDFNLPQDVCVQWVQLWHSRTAGKLKTQ